MLQALRVVTAESFLLLRRDRIFLPAAIAGLLIGVFANIASDWGTEDFTKILFDIGAFGFHLTGSFVAIFWGGKAIAEAQQEGSLEVQLAAPIHRGQWLLGKFLGLACALLLLGLSLVGLWQALMLLNDFGMMTGRQLAIFAFLWLGWLVLGALALFFSSFCRQTVAMFATLSLWLTGLVSAPIAASLTPETPVITSVITKNIARFWDLRQLSLVDKAFSNNWLTLEEILWRASYGGLLIVLLISVASVIFVRRDLSS